MRKASITYFERDAMIEELAKRFHQKQGYFMNAPQGFRMQDSRDPRIRLSVELAIIAIDFVSAG